MKTFRAQQRFCAGSVLVAGLVMAIVGFVPILAHRAEASEVLLGLYSDIIVHHDIDVQLIPAGKRTNVTGIYLIMDDPIQNVPFALIDVWANGRVPYVNLMTTSTTAAIANGSRDAAIRNFAHYFALWAATGRRAFLATFPEMNGRWHQDTYYGPPATFVAAFRRIRQIFEQELTSQGAPLSAVSWVFAPNGWSEPGDEFEHYYPGTDVVDIVSTTGFNFGGCPGPTAGVWDTFDTALRPYLDRLGPMAPGKPLFITETGTVDVPAQGVGDKNQWLQELFTRLASYPRFRGVVYFNLMTGPASTLPSCPQGVDYRLTRLDGTLWPGFFNAMATLPQYAYWAPDSPQMANIVFGRQPTQIFADVLTFHPFALEDGEVDFSSWIHALSAAGVTAGCATAPLRYCPNLGVTRAQMAIFLLKAKHGSNFVPPPATGIFDDVPADSTAKWIEGLAAEGITGGCSLNPPLYCPANSVTRKQMAMFLLKAKHGSSYQPPPATGIFNDVAADNFRPWIEQLAAEGITGGCGGGNFCPENPVTRGQMAVFLVKAFNLPH